jgi:hypothetical protein
MQNKMGLERHAGPRADFLSPSSEILAIDPCLYPSAACISTETTTGTTASSDKIITDPRMKLLLRQVALRPPFLARARTAVSPLAQKAFNPLQPGVPTTEDCIPLSPPYSLSSLIARSPPLPEETLRKLHQLACLPYPSGITSQSLQELIGVVDGIRSERVQKLLAEAEAEGARNLEDMGWGRKEIVFDGTTEDGVAREQLEADGELDERQGRALLQDAKKTAGGAYYTVNGA